MTCHGRSGMAGRREPRCISSANPERAGPRFLPLVRLPGVGPGSVGLMSPDANPIAAYKRRQSVACSFQVGYDCSKKLLMGLAARQLFQRETGSIAVGVEHGNAWDKLRGLHHRRLHDPTLL